MLMLLEKLQLQGWKDIVLQMDGKLARSEIVEFMENVRSKMVGSPMCLRGWQ